MRWLIAHATHPRWERGEPPPPEMIRRVGELMGAMQTSGCLRGAEGLRATALGLRLRGASGQVSGRPGPLVGENELLDGFEIVRVATLAEAEQWGRRLAALLGEVEIDVRRVTEPWDIGLTPEPSSATGARFMLLRKATDQTEGMPGDARRKQRSALAQFRRELKRAGVLTAAESLEPSRFGCRLVAAGSDVRVVDGPFSESKEMIAGYAVIEVAAREDALAWAHRYLTAVESTAVEVRRVDEDQVSSTSAEPKTTNDTTKVRTQ